jgi:hypothetical protein
MSGHCALISAAQALATAEAVTKEAANVAGNAEATVNQVATAGADQVGARAEIVRVDRVEVVRVDKPVAAVQAAIVQAVREEDNISPKDRKVSKVRKTLRLTSASRAITEVTLKIKRARGNGLNN